MKTKTLIFGMVIAIIGTLTISKAHAQVEAEPAVKVVPGLEKNSIKVIYGYSTKGSVGVKFVTRDGLLEKDYVNGKDFQTGFIKKYNMEIVKDNIFWVEIDSDELSTTFKMIPYKNGKWIAELEKTTYNHTALAKR